MSADRCEQRDIRRAQSGRIYTVWCKRPQAPDARERVGELGSLLCEKHAAERA